MHDRFGPQVFNFAGIGNVEGTAITPPAPSPAFPIDNRDEWTTELYARDAIRIDEQWTAWLGARHSQLQRGYRQSFTTPWLAASFQWSSDSMAYASWGRGVESAVAPQLPIYTNAGQPLPALQSRQFEVGLKGASEAGLWSLAWFDISRPLFSDVGTCDADNTCTRVIDGVAHHRGVEANVGARHAALTLQAGVQLLQARREDSQTAALNGKRPTNVPARTLKLHAGYAVASMPGLSVDANLAADSNRMVLDDNSLRIPGQARVDLALRYAQSVSAGRAIVWRAGVDNLFDRRAWKESPREFGHTYLFPLPPRTLRLSVEAAL